MKVAVVHYWFISRRGGEKVVESILKLYPNADIYTLFYNEKLFGDRLKNHNVYTSILDHRLTRKYYQKLFALYPVGIGSLKLKKKYDLVISSESGPAKGIKLDQETPHVCYVHSPMRYCWSHMDVYLHSVNYFIRPIVRFFLKKLRTWDKTTIDNVGLYIANSENVANRVNVFYNKVSKVVYPPINETLFNQPLSQQTIKDTYLSFGALVPYKRIDLLVDTFNKNGKKLVIIGEGPEKKKLEKRARRNIEFKGNLKWNEIEKEFNKTRALLFPGEEDFGMIPLEVMAYGIPVIAYKKGGALETVLENKNDVSKSTGIFFETQSEIALNNAIHSFEEVETTFNAQYIREHAAQFSEKVFLDKFSVYVNRFMQGNKNGKN